MDFNLYSALLKIFLKSEMSHFTLLKKAFSFSFLCTIPEEDCITNAHTWFNQQSFLSWAMISFCRRNEKVHKSVSLGTKKMTFFFKLPGLEKDAEVVDFKLLSGPFIFSRYLEVFKLSHVLHIYTRILKITVIPRHTLQAIVKIDVSG